MNAAIRFVGSLASVAALAMSIAACSEDMPMSPYGDDSEQMGRVAPMERPIDEFVRAQGGDAGSGISVPPDQVAGAIGWIDASRGITAVVDYAGAEFRRQMRAVPVETAEIGDEEKPAEFDVVSLEETVVDPGTPPKYSGRVVERVLLDGTVRVIVELNTTGALSYAVYGMAPRLDALAFGAREYRDPEAVRGDSRLVLVYRAAGPGMPMPLVSDLLYKPQPGQRLEYISFSSSATPAIMSKASPGTLVVEQPGIGANDPYMGAVGTLPAAWISIE